MERPQSWLREERKIYLRDVFFLALIVFFSIFISEQFLLGTDAALVDRIFTYLLLFIPLGTLNLIGHYYYRNRRIRLTGNLRSSLRYRLSIAFMLIAIIPSLPIFLISANNVDTVLESLFSLNVARGVEGAERLIQRYERDAATDLYVDLLRAEPGLSAGVNDAAVAVDRLARAGALDGERDYAGVYRGGKIVQQSRNLVSTGALELFGEQGAFAGASTEPDAFVRARLREADYALLRFPLTGGDGWMIVGRRLHPGLEKERRDFEQVYASFQDESFWQERAPGTLRLGLALLYIFMICAALMLSILIARQISMPIVALAAATRQVTDGDLEARIETHAVGELGVLIDSFNQMTAELRSLRARLLHSQRLAAWQEVARRLAHEIKNPLTPIQLSADRMLRRLDHPERGDVKNVVRSGCATIIEQVKVLKRLVEEFANFARLPKARLSPQSVDAIVTEAVHGFQGAIPGIQLDMHLSGNLPDIAIDKTILIGMINNLVKNAAEAIYSIPSEARRAPARILISTELVRQGARQFVTLKVEDTGPGVDEALLDRIFEPYFSTKSGYGTGLGLSLVERAALEHDARLMVTRSELGGAAFSVWFRRPEN